MITDYKMRQKCRCGNEIGFIEQKNGQNVVRCSECKKAVYNAPSSELNNSTELRRIIPDRQKVRIFERDGFRCMACGKTPVEQPGIILHVSHIISVADAQAIKKAYGVAAEKWLNDDENLFTCCADCNLSQGGRSHIPKIAVFITQTIRRLKK